jgi:response regulator RpfG family c-di-GMP phosphodiesterase
MKKKKSEVDNKPESLNMSDRETARILIVDDEEPIRYMLCQILDMGGYSYSAASDSREARAILNGQDFELVLCDVNMPGESGMDFIKFISAAYPETAIIMVTGQDDPELAESALDMGAYGYMIKPFKVSELMINISNALRRRKLEISNRIYIMDMEKVVDERTEDVRKAMEMLRKSMEGIIQAMSSTIEMRDPYTAGHQQRVADLARSVSVEMGLSKERVEGVRMAGLIHDLGKIAVPAEILTKPGRLNDIEFNLIKLHCQAGYDILKDIEFPWPISKIVLQHHERMDGSGYPHGVSGEELLLESRILAVADVVEAMASHRPYRAALGLEAATEEISKKKGVLYDPTVVDACVKIISNGKFQFKPS